MKITFTSRETYLQWAADWKAQYATLSQFIRDLKFARSFHQSTLHPSMLAQGYQPQGTNEARYLALYARCHDPRHGWNGWRIYLHLLEAKTKATLMLEVRKESKVEAQCQYLEARSMLCGTGAGQ